MAFPSRSGGRLTSLVAAAGRVYGAQRQARTVFCLDATQAGIFRVPKNPPFIDLASAVLRDRRGRADAQVAGKEAERLREQIRRTYVWKNGIPQRPEAMQLTSGKKGIGDRIRKITKYEFTWQRDVPLYPNAMLVADRHFVMAGPPRFDEAASSAFLSTAATDRFEPSPPVRDALETFQGRKGGVLLVANKADGQTLAEIDLPAPPVFDGMIDTGGRLLLALQDGSVIAVKTQPPRGSRLRFISPPAENPIPVPP